MFSASIKNQIKNQIIQFLKKGNGKEKEKVK